MRNIPAETIVDAVAELCRKANYLLPDDVLSALQAAAEREESPVGKGILDPILKNASIASEGIFPICQDCGLAVFFVEIGSEVHVEGMTLEQALTEGTRKGYLEHYLRKSVVTDPFTRINSNDNTPPLIHTKCVAGDRLRIRFMPKGSGSENMSLVRMLSPADGIEGVKKAVLECVETAGAKSCPPVTVGVGIGGSLGKCAELAKLALFRPIGTEHEQPFYRDLEAELLDSINRLGIGPLGLGGTVTALAVHIDAAPCHIASLPVAVNLQCHAARRAEVEL
ncbi:MAG: fumarate hydratase [Candidatus Coatesbacteria bacterium]|nr:fumarate hydratase [Candidatus Coatesbacteria bacterium]